MRPTRTYPRPTFPRTDHMHAWRIKLRQEKCIPYVYFICLFWWEAIHATAREVYSLMYTFNLGRLLRLYVYVFFSLLRERERRDEPEIFDRVGWGGIWRWCLVWGRLRRRWSAGTCLLGFWATTSRMKEVGVLIMRWTAFVASPKPSLLSMVLMAMVKAKLMQKVM